MMMMMMSSTSLKHLVPHRSCIPGALLHPFSSLTSLARSSRHSFARSLARSRPPSAICAWKQAGFLQAFLIFLLCNARSDRTPGATTGPRGYPGAAGTGRFLFTAVGYHGLVVSYSLSFSNQIKHVYVLRSMRRSLSGLEDSYRVSAGLSLNLSVELCRFVQGGDTDGLLSHLNHCTSRNTENSNELCICVFSYHSHMQMIDQSLSARTLPFVGLA